MDNENSKLHTFDLATFKNSQRAMVSTNDATYGVRRGAGRILGKNYTENEVKAIIDSGSLSEKQALSRSFFAKEGFYKQLIVYYATLLKYTGLLIPNPKSGKKLSTPHIQKKYMQALEYVSEANLEVVLVEWAQKVLTDGCFYGVLGKNDKNTFAVLPLPVGYCRTRFQDVAGNDLLEFNLSYFNTILDESDRKAALSAYPDFIVSAYNKFKKGKSNMWIIVPPEIGVCFPMLDQIPFFLDVIPSTMKYECSVELEQERQREEINKIIVQKIPHLNDGRLLFEPDEAAEMHDGAVGMVKNNQNTTVLTTYADVTAVTSRGANEATSSNALEAMRQSIYSHAGVSSEIFAASGGNTTETSIKYDTAIMMYLANKFARFITGVINKNFANSNISFKYAILPITTQNEAKFIENSYKLASSGYSLILPALALGLNQRDLISVKELENDVLKITEVLIPPKNSFTDTGEEDAGRPTKEVEDKRDKTLKNEKSKEGSKTQGGTE